MEILKYKPELIDEILKNLELDYIGFWIIYSMIKKELNTDDLNETLVYVIFCYLDNLLEQDNIYIGDLLKDENGNSFFKKWNNSKKSENILEIIRRWSVLDFKEPNIGEVCYFTKNSMT